MIIGICGKSGCGKSTLANYIMNNNENSTSLDIDKIGHYVLTLKEVENELVKCFGNDILNNKNIDRTKLGDIVFNSRFEMKKLTDITWYYMEIEIDRFLEKNKDKMIVLDWQLLPKTKYFEMCDLKILLDIPYNTRKQRAILRDNISSEDFDLREQASINFNYEDFDYVFKDNEEIIKRLVINL